MSAPAAMSITNSLIAHNSAEGDQHGGYGGGILQTAGYLELVSCTIADNTALHGGGGLRGEQCLDAYVYNTVFWGNTGTAGPQMSVLGDTLVWSSDVQGGEEAIETGSEGTLAWIDNNIQEDPLFLDPEGSDGDPDNDYRLDVGPPLSPCVDAGDRYAIFGSMDLDGNPRISGCTLDMGAHEATFPPVQPPTDGDEVAKNRYISFVPGSPGLQTAYRVVLMDSPEFEYAEGWHWWVGEPQDFSENSGIVYAVPDWPTFKGATLECQPYYNDWSTVGTVHVSDVEIVPGARYEVQAIEEGCDPAVEESYTDPLVINTSIWGDLVNNCVTCPCGPPDGSVGIATDVTALLDKFKNLGPPLYPCPAVRKVRADLDWATPNRRIDISDVTFCLDAFRGDDYPAARDPPPAPAWTDPLEQCPPLGGCRADILADSNYDGEIDYFDDFFEEFQGVTVVFNSDDDNDNGIPDWEETEVDGEDDLVEMRLSAPSCSEYQWDGWSLSWEGTAPLMVWWESDKSCPGCDPCIYCPPCLECPGVAPVINFNDPPDPNYPPIYPITPLLPRSVWLEATDATGEDFEITFTIHAPEGGKRSFAASEADKTDKVKARNPKCTPGRWYAGFMFGTLGTPASIEATGTSVKITTPHEEPQLCFEPGGAKVSAASAAWTGVAIEHGGQPVRWAQLGCTRSYTKKDGLFTANYIETLAGPSASEHDLRFFNKNDVPPDEHEYKCVLEQATGAWEYLLDSVRLDYSAADTHAGWRSLTGNVAGWRAEIWNREDQMVGKDDLRCPFKSCKYREGSGVFRSKTFTQAELQSSDPQQWGIQLIYAVGQPPSSDSFEVWDKIP